MSESHPGLYPERFGYASVEELETSFLDDCNPDTYDLLYAVDQNPELLETCVDLVYEVVGLWEALHDPGSMPFAPWCRDLLDALRRRAPNLTIGPDVTPWRFGYWLLARMVADGHGQGTTPRPT